MFRPLFRSLFASRPQARTRPKISFRPQLEALEHRYAPAPTGLGGSIVQTQINAANNSQVGVGSNILQKQINTGFQGTETAIGTNDKEIQVNNGAAVQATELGSGNTIVEKGDSYTTVIALNGSTGVVTGKSGGIEIFT